MNISYQFSSHGFEIHPQACPPDLLLSLQSEFPLDAPADWELLDRSPTVRSLAESGLFQTLAATILGPSCHPTHAILYNKTAGNNTAQDWHQDTTVKSGSTFVEAESDEVFSSLVSLRLSLDDCTFFDGALKLCPSSHKHGRLRLDQVKSHAARPFSSPDMKAGDILLMHPLTIHASGASTTLKPRRVIHVVYKV